MPDERIPKALDDLLQERSDGLDAEATQVFSALMLQLLSVKLLKALGGSHTLEEGLPVEDVIDAGERVVLDGLLDTGPLKLTVMPIPEEERSPRVREMVNKLKAEDKPPGRNEPCPCGSGKKYKRCHGFGAPI